MGNQIAVKLLAGADEDDEAPECPESLRYLLGWIHALHGRSGVGMSSLAPLSWTTIESWSRLTGNIPDQEDLDALFLLDAIMLTPPKEGE
jgi:hypothetical protein